MSARAEIRASSIVGLYRQATIESLPIEEVRADLERLGVDPVPSTELAKRLALGNADDPATALLRKLEELEDIDAEVAALENAPIDEVRSILSDEAVEAVSGAARERSIDEERDGTEATADEGDGATVVPLTWRRFAKVGWRAPLIGIAASVALFVAIRPDVLQEMERAGKAQSPIERRLSTVEADLAADSEAIDSEIIDQSAETVAEDVVSPPPAARARRLQPDVAAIPPADDRRPDAVEALDPQGDREAALALGEELTRAPAAEERAGLLPAERSPPPAPSSPDLTNDEADAVRQASEGSAEGDESRSVTPSHLPTAKPAPTSRELAALITDKVRARQPADTSPEGQVPTPTVVTGIPELPEDLTGVFIVEADAVPPALEALASAWPDDRLAAKVGEASLRALGRKVLALVAFERDGQRVEAALVEIPQAPPPAALTAETTVGATAFAGGEVPSPGASERSFELIELPADD